MVSVGRSVVILGVGGWTDIILSRSFWLRSFHWVCSPYEIGLLCTVQMGKGALKLTFYDSRL